MIVEHRLKVVTVVILFASFFTSCQPKTDTVRLSPGSVEHIRSVTETIDDSALRAADETPGDWLSYGRNYSEDRYSPLDQINKNNLDQLGLAWSLELDSNRGIQATPIVVDGIMYFTGPWSVVYAVDARKGEILWKFDPDVPRQKAADMCCGIVNRGVALYKGDIFVGTMDGRLISIDAASGEQNWSVMTVPQDGNYSITGAPRVANGKILIGNAGAEMAYVRGYVTAYDAATGQQVWRFYTTPGDPSEPFEAPELEMAAATWNGEYWKTGTGGTAWDAIVYDADFDQVLIGVGNGSHWDRDVRSPGGGDNLFLSSIVAVDADTGAYKWHYQTTPGDTWDYTATQPIILADLEIDGAVRRTAMQAPKNGFFYVLDRSDGALISAKPFTYVNWATGIGEDGRPIEREGARYTDGKTHWITPSSHGAHNWFPMSYNHKTGLVYIPGVVRSGPYAAYSDIPFYENGTLRGNDMAVSIPFRAFDEQVIDPKAPLPGSKSGELIAYDPVKQKRVWEVPQPGHYNGGLLSTSTGLLMQGDAEGKFSIRDAETGEVLWDFNVRSGVISSPVTYTVDDQQYITVIAEWGGGQGQTFRLTDALYNGTVYTFKLGGTASAPPSKPSERRTLSSLSTDASDIEIGWGYTHYIQNCIGCHNLPGGNGGAIPNLARSDEAIFENYQDILRRGALAEIGMPKHEHLSEQDVDHLKSYIIFVAQSLREETSPRALNATIARYQKKAWEAGPIQFASPQTISDPVESSGTQESITIAGDAVAGKRAAAICSSCHTFDKGGRHGIGPNLWGIVESDIASIDGVKYSSALLGVEGVWSHDKLDAFLKAPGKFAQGTSMTVGAAREKQRQDIIAYLKTLQD